MTEVALNNHEERQALDRADWNRCMQAYGPDVNRCAGGRVVARGYVCPHCDSINPSEDCGEPIARG